mmetsp:Transcript_36275/g.80745  ORF Transcript_36275/g.80745 Transcript_36275/m.80745 type:complete len:235 (+) Transcript_36275:86-790(+)
MVEGVMALTRRLVKAVTGRKAASLRAASPRKLAQAGAATRSGTAADLGAKPPAEAKAGAEAEADERVGVGVGAGTAGSTSLAGAPVLTSASRQPQTPAVDTGHPFQRLASAAGSVAQTGVAQAAACHPPLVCAAHLDLHLQQASPCHLHLLAACVTPPRHPPWASEASPSHLSLFMWLAWTPACLRRRWHAACSGRLRACAVSWASHCTWTGSPGSPRAQQRWRSPQMRMHGRR